MMGEKKTNQTSRIMAFDLARFLGISIVVLQHSGFMSTEALVFWTSFSMPLFFVISGYFLGREIRKNGREIAGNRIGKRAKRLLIPYAFFSVLYLVVYVLLELFHGRTPKMPAVLDLIGKTLSLYGPSVTWFLSALFLAELLIRMIVSRKWGIRLPGIALFAGMIIALIFLRDSLIAGQGFWNDLLVAFLRLPVCALWIFIGCLLQALNRCMAERGATKKCPLPVRMGFRAVLSAFLFAAAYFVSSKNGLTDLSCLVYGNSFFLMLGAGAAGTLGTLLICSLPDLFDGKIPVLPWLGQHSLTILLTHLDLRILYLATLAFKRTLSGAFLLLAILIGTMLLEVPVILLTDRFLPFAVGKEKQ